MDGGSFGESRRSRASLPDPSPANSWGPTGSKWGIQFAWRKNVAHLPHIFGLRPPDVPRVRCRGNPQAMRRNRQCPSKIQNVRRTFANTYRFAGRMAARPRFPSIPTLHLPIEGGAVARTSADILVRNLGVKRALISAVVHYFLHYI